LFDQTGSGNPGEESFFDQINECMKAIKTKLLEGTHIWHRNMEINEKFFTTVVPGQRCDKRINELRRHRGRTEFTQEQSDYLHEEYFDVLGQHIRNATTAEPTGKSVGN
jgi:hypothetical protein